GYTDLPIYRDWLASALGFDASDLSSNRAGRLGPGQHRTQMRQLLKTSAGTLFLLALAVLFAFIALAAGLSSRIGIQSMLAVAACLFGAGYFGWFGLRLGLDLGRRGLQHRRVRQTNGARDPSGRWLPESSGLDLLLECRRPRAVCRDRQGVWGSDGRSPPPVLPAAFAPCRCRRASVLGDAGSWVRRRWQLAQATLAAGSGDGGVGYCLTGDK